MAEQPEQPDPANQANAGEEASSAANVEQALEGAQASLDDVQQAVDAQGTALEQGAEAAGETGAAGDDTAWMPEAKPRNSDGTPAGIELLGDVDLDVTIELGRTEMLVEDVLRLAAGSVVELDKLAGDPVDVHVNGRLVARGEVLVLNDNFCIRINEIVANLEEEAEAAAEREQAQQAAVQT